MAPEGVLIPRPGGHDNRFSQINERPPYRRRIGEGSFGRQTGRDRMSRLIALLASLFLFVLCAGQAQALPGEWEFPSIDLSSNDGPGETPLVGSGADRSKVVVWKASGTSDSTRSEVRARIQSPGGQFNPARTISKSDSNVRDLRLAVGPDGTAVAVWRYFNRPSGTWVVQASIRPVRGEFGPVQTVSNPTWSAFEPEVAAGPQGSSMVVWVGSNGGKDVIHRAFRLPGKAFELTRIVNPAPDINENPSVSIGPDGFVALAWQGWRTDGSRRVFLLVTGPNGLVGYLTKLPVPDGMNDVDPDVVLDSDRTATVVWRRVKSPAGNLGSLPLANGLSSRIMAVDVPWNEDPGEERNVSYPLNIGNEREPQIALSGGGITTIAWASGAGDIAGPVSSPGLIQVSTRYPGWNFQSSPTVLRTGNAAVATPRLSGGEDGTTAVTWIRGADGQTAVESSVRRPGRAFGPVTRLSESEGTSSSPAITVDPAGRVTAVWDQAANVGNAVRTASASETIPHYPVSIDRTGSGDGVIQSDYDGLDCGVSCTTTVEHGTEIALTASPSPGDLFEGWSGACTGSGEVCVFTVEGPAQVTASFSKVHPLNVQPPSGGEVVGGSGGARVDCGGICSKSLTHGTEVSLRPDPVSGSRFVGWGGACEGAGEVCSLVMDGAKSVSAQFTRVHWLSVVSVGGGRVISDPSGIDCGTGCRKAFEEGQKVRLVAEPDAGRDFVGWTGPCSGAASSTCEVSMSAARDVTAKFTGTRKLMVDISSPSLGTVRAEGGGLSCGSTTCSGAFPIGETVKLTAVSASGALFTGWSGVCMSSRPVCEVVVDRDLRLIANFAFAETLQVNVAGEGSGTVISDPAAVDCATADQSCEGRFALGSTVTLTATPGEGSEFVGWADRDTGQKWGCRGTDPVCEVTLGMPITATAIFKPAPATEKIESETGPVVEEESLPSEVSLCEATGVQVAGIRTFGHGAAKVRLRASDPGVVKISKPGLIQATTRKVNRAGTTTIRIRPAARTRKKLRNGLRVKVPININYTPFGQCATTTARANVILRKG